MHENPLARDWPGAPRCFRESAHAAHLMDQDRDRLTKTAKRLGVRRVVIDQAGRPGQHVDLCGKPYERARGECDGLL